MCGRYIHPEEKYFSRIGNWARDVERSYNVAPSQLVPVWVGDELVMARWGLIPTWAKDTKSKYSTINARVEKIASSNAYRHAWANAQRCLIPAWGYYEWQGPKGDKQPYLIRAASGDTLEFAGLYEPERDGLPASCTIITQPACDALSDLHPRMPLCLLPDHMDDWWDSQTDQAMEILLDGGVADFEYWAVSKAVGNVRNNDPRLIEPVGL